MSDKDLRSQLEGLFSDIVPKPETEKGEAVFGPVEAEPAEAKVTVSETPPIAGVASTGRTRVTTTPRRSGLSRPLRSTASGGWARC